MKEDFTYCDQVSIDEEAHASSVQRLTHWTLEIRCIENAWIVPFSNDTVEFQGEVVTSDGDIIQNVCSGSIYREGHKLKIPMVEDEQDEIIYMGSLNLCWGHYITDGISKLWCLENDEFWSLVNRGVPVMFVSEWMSVDQMPIAWRHLVDLLGGEKVKIVPLQKTTKFKRIYIPSNTIQNSTKGRFYTNEFTQICRKLKQAALANFSSGRRFDRIYLSRTKLANGGHSEVGEHHIERAFRKAGFHIIYPEKYSFEHQVYLLENAQQVAGTVGSISHNFMFCSPGTDAIILRKAWYTNDFQYVINQVSDLNVTYMDCHLSVFTTNNPNLGPFFLYVNDNLRQFLKSRFDVDVKNSFAVRDYMRYIRKCLQKADMKQRTESPEYYFHKLREELNRVNWKQKIHEWLRTKTPNYISDIVLRRIVRLMK